MTRTLRRAWHRLAGALSFRRSDRDITEELESHVRLLTEENVRRGMSPVEAERQARIRFGNVAAMKDRYQDQASLPALDLTVQDVRFACRSFLRSPRFTVPAVVALALGVGATSAIFSIVRGVIVAPLPYRDPERIVAIWERRIDRPERPRNVIASANFQEWRERARSFEKIGMVGPARETIVLDGQPQEIAGFAASADALAALGTQPQLGRLYSPEEDLDSAERVMVISHEFWQTRLAGRKDVLGLSLTVDQQPRTIVGVMPPHFTLEGQPGHYLMPYGWNVEQLRQSPGRGYSHGIARLRDGVTFEQAEQEMRTLMAELEREVPQRNTNWTSTLVPIHEQTVDQIRPALYVLSGAVVLVLLIGCVNVANLLLARATVRQRELGLRTALGASRGRLLRQLLTGSILLSLVGGVLGLALAAAFHRGVLALVGNRIRVPRLDQVALDAPMVVFTLAMALVTGVVFGVAPALFATSTSGNALGDSGRHGSGPRARRLLGTLVVAEVALSLVLLAGAGLLIRSVIALQNVDSGMRTAGVLTARVTLSGQAYDTDHKRGAFYTDVLSELRALPGVDSASAVSFLPMAGLGIGTGYHRLDRPRPEPGKVTGTDVKPVAPDFFRTMGIPVIAGRDFTRTDAHDAPHVAIVNQALVRQQYPGEDPIGKRLNVSIGSADDGMNVEIVGVVGDIKMVRLDRAVDPAVYLPHTQLPIGMMTFVVRTSRDPLALVPGVTAAVHAVDATLPLADVATMDSVVETTLARPRTVSVLLTAFALIALVLAGVGVYGVMAYSVSQRTHEIGVRTALGATSSSVFRMMLSESLRLVALGIAVGLLAAGWLSRFLTAMLFQTTRFDLLTFVTTALVLVGVATLASLIPARRGTRIAPVEALRTE